MMRIVRLCESPGQTSVLVVQLTSGEDDRHDDRREPTRVRIVYAREREVDRVAVRRVAANDAEPVLCSCRCHA